LNVSKVLLVHWPVYSVFCVKTLLKLEQQQYSTDRHYCISVSALFFNVLIHKIFHSVTRLPDRPALVAFTNDQVATTTGLLLQDVTATSDSAQITLVHKALSQSIIVRYETIMPAIVLIMFNEKNNF